MAIWKSVVGKLWMTIIGLVAIVLLILGMFFLQYIDLHFANSNQVKRLFVYTGIIGFLLTTFFAFFLSTKITQPLLQLNKAAVLISKGQYDARVEIRSSDEIGELAKTFNLMAERLDKTIQDLHDEKEHLASVLRSMADGVVTFDTSGNVVLANPEGEKIINEWRHKKWAGQSDEEFADEEEKRIPEPLLSTFESVTQGKKEMTSKIHVDNDVWSVVMAPLYSASETIRGAVAVLRDVTEEYRLNKLRKDFVANVSHELRTPLSMLQGYSEALLDDIADSPEERKEIANVILDESLRMSRLVEDLLDLARTEAGHLVMQFDQVDLNSLITKVQRRFAPMAREQGIGLARNLPESPLFLTRADEDRLEQVLTNLLANAIRHTPAGANIEVRASAQYASDGSSAALIEVADEGEGIPSEHLLYIFERFYKADRARTRGVSGGTGLGLAIVKNIIDAHRGTIDVRSKQGEGTTFVIKLPI